MRGLRCGVPSLDLYPALPGGDVYGVLGAARACVIPNVTLGAALSRYNLYLPLSSLAMLSISILSTSTLSSFTLYLYLYPFYLWFSSPSSGAVQDIWPVLLLTTLPHDPGRMGSGRVGSSVLLN